MTQNDFLQLSDILLPLVVLHYSSDALPAADALSVIDPRQATAVIFRTHHNT
jgi:hypothetical protein